MKTQMHSMKYMLTLAIHIALCTIVTAQMQGKIVFEEKIDMHRRLPPERAEMKDMIPQYRSSKYELHYTQDVSKYKTSDATDEEVVGTQGNAQFRMKMTAPKREVYKNLGEDRMVDEREFMTKMFLIKGGVSPFPWKIADGQKKIMDYVCLQATYQDSTTKYVVWFTPQIPISNGPAEYGGLPGMIMQVDMNDGERTLTAVEVVEQEVDMTILQEPTKGKEVTQEEFKQIMQEKMKEMEAMHGGSGPQMIIRHN
jgi:GLPGLI family protein